MSSKTNHPKSAPSVEQFKGIIVQRANAFYYMLPEHVRRSVLLEDWIQDGMAFVATKVLSNATGTRPASVWNESKGAPSTFVYTAVTNYYKQQLTSLTCKKRGSITISYDDQPSVIYGVGRWEHHHMLDADKVVSRMHENASVELIRFLDKNLFTGPCSPVAARTAKFNEYKAEFQSLAQRYGVTITHYRNVVHKEKGLRACHQSQPERRGR